MQAKHFKNKIKRGMEEFYHLKIFKWCVQDIGKILFRFAAKRDVEIQSFIVKNA